MPRTIPYQIELSAAELEELESLARKYTAPYQAEKAGAVLDLDQRLWQGKNLKNSECGIQGGRKHRSPRVGTSHEEPPVP